MRVTSQGRRCVHNSHESGHLPSQTSILAELALAGRHGGAVPVLYDRRVFVGAARLTGSALMAAVSANHNSAEGFCVCLGRQPFLYDQAVDLIVVWDERTAFTTLALLAEQQALERIEDGFCAVIHIKDA